MAPESQIATLAIVRSYRGTDNNCYSSLLVAFVIVERTCMEVVYKKRATSAFFHIFPSLPLHFPNSCHKLHCSKEKMRLPKTLLMDTLILNLKPFLSESSNKVVPQNIFPKLSLQKSLKKRQNNLCWDS